MKDSIFVKKSPERFFKSIAWLMASYDICPEGSNYIDADLVHKAEMCQLVVERDILYYMRKVQEVKHV